MQSVNDMTLNECFNENPTMENAQKFDPSKHSILVIDDDLDQLHCMETIVRRGGYRVQTTTSAKGCFDALQENSFSVIVSDIMMPGIDGIELVKRLRTTSFNRLKTPVILVSAGREDLEFRAVLEGAYMFCAKRLLKDQLVNQIGLLLD